MYQHLKQLPTNDFLPSFFQAPDRLEKQFFMRPNELRDKFYRVNGLQAEEDLSITA